MAKKYISLLIISVLMAVCLFAVSADVLQDSVTNGGFEAGDTSGWLKYGKGLNLALDVTTDAHNGNYAAVVSNRTAYNEGLSQSLELLYGRTYISSVWIKADSGSNKFTWLADSAILKWKHLVRASALTPGSWTQLSDEWKLEGEGKVTFTARIEEIPVSSGAVTPTVYFDDFSIVPKYQINTLRISGTGTVMIPQSGTRTEEYTGTAFNQFGDTKEMPGDVSWSLETSVEGVSIDENGGLTISSEAQPGEVTLVAKATDLGKEVTASFVVSLTEYISEDEILSIAQQALTYQLITNEESGYITKDLNLPGKGEYGTVITWSSSNEAVISVSGIVNRAYYDEDVTLTATIASDNMSVQKQFLFKVIANRNLIKDSGFEESALDKWVQVGLKAEHTNNEPHSGNNCIRLSGLTESWYTVEQTISVPNNKPYIYSVWLRVPQGSINGKFTIGVRLGSTYNHLETKDVIANNEWVKISSEYKFSGVEGEKTNLTVYVFSRTAISEYFMDDFTADTVKPENLNITGADEIRLPSSQNQVIKNYSTLIKDQLDRQLVADSINWAIKDIDGNDTVQGVSVNSDGDLVVSGEAQPGKIILMAIVGFDGLTTVGEKEITLLPYLNEMNAVSKSLDWLTASSISVEDLHQVTKNLTLAASYESVGETPDYIVSFAWSSSNTDVIANDGRVVRDEASDKTITLTVTATLGEVTKTKSFVITVLRLDNLIDNPEFEENTHAPWFLTDGTG